MVLPPEARIEQGGYEIRLLPGGSPEHAGAERELLADGVAVPLPHRAVWTQFRPAAGFWFLLVRNAAGQCAGGFTLEVARSRALPGHLTLLSERFGDSLPIEVAPLAIQALSALARQDRRILRADIEIFSRDERRRAALGTALAGGGFTSVPLRRSYADTLTEELLLSEDEHLAALSANTRRHVRAIHKKPVALRLVEDEAFAPRVDALLAETMERTGGAYQSQDWCWRIGLSKAAPQLSRLIGLFRTDTGGPESLLAFAWGCHHGEYAHYDAAGSTRRSDLKMSFSYSLMWDLMCWARRHGARWWDFGGITDGHLGGEDPVGGISDFKRHFSTTVQRVGERWVLEPNPLRAGLARGVTTLVNVIRRVRS